MTVTEAVLKLLGEGVELEQASLGEAKEYGQANEEAAERLIQGEVEVAALDLMAGEVDEVRCSLVMVEELKQQQGPEALGGQQQE
jgi:hypothetical protein